MDRDPALRSVTCPECLTANLRQGITTFFVRHYYVYCKHCGYETKPNISSTEGLKEWINGMERIEIE